MIQMNWNEQDKTASFIICGTPTKPIPLLNEHHGYYLMELIDNGFVEGWNSALREIATYIEDKVVTDADR